MPVGVSPQTSGDKNYVHNQVIASTEWIIEHNLNKYPSIEVYDSTDRRVIGEIEFINNSSARILFSAPFSGKAVCN